MVNLVVPINHIPAFRAFYRHSQISSYLNSLTPHSEHVFGVVIVPYIF